MNRQWTLKRIREWMKRYRQRERRADTWDNYQSEKSTTGEIPRVQLLFIIVVYCLNAVFGGYCLILIHIQTIRYNYLEMLSTSFITIFILWVFSHYLYRGDFCWSLSDSKSPWITRILLSIRADVICTLIWIVFIFPVIYNFSGLSFS